MLLEPSHHTVRMHKQPHGQTTIPADITTDSSNESLKMWPSEPSDIKSLQPLNLPSRGPRHHTAETKPMRWALSKCLTQRIYEPKTMVVVLRHLVWVCYTATDNHTDCFKAIGGHGKFMSAEKARQKFPENLPDYSKMRLVAGSLSRKPMIQYSRL